MNALPLPALVALLLLAAYLVGSLSFAVIVSRFMGLADPRSYGSKNPGATNVLRSGNKAAALLTLAFDALKGYVPVLLVLIHGPRHGLGEVHAAFVGLAAFVGHLWPVFFRFQGGKGVATAAGVLFAVNPVLGVATLASFGILVYFTRYVSLASMTAAAFAPFFHALMWGADGVTVALLVMGLLLVWRHEGNIRKLLAGTENRFGAKAADATPASATKGGRPPRHLHASASAPASRKKGKH